MSHSEVFTEEMPTGNSDSRDRRNRDVGSLGLHVSRCLSESILQLRSPSSVLLHSQQSLKPKKVGKMIKAEKWNIYWSDWQAVIPSFSSSSESFGWPSSEAKPLNAHKHSHEQSRTWLHRKTKNIRNMTLKFMIMNLLVCQNKNKNKKKLFLN